MYTPRVNHKDVKKAVYKNWHLIQQNQLLSEIFPKPPLVAFRKAKNIRERIIRAKLNIKDTDVPNKQPNDNPINSDPNEETDPTLNILLSHTGGTNRILSTGVYSLKQTNGYKNFPSKIHKHKSVSCQRQPDPMGPNRQLMSAPTLRHESMLLLQG